MRTLDSIFNHEPLWCIEWRDADGNIAQVSIMNEEAYNEYQLKDMAAIILEVGGATSVKITQIAGERQ